MGTLCLITNEFGRRSGQCVGNEGPFFETCGSTQEHTTSQGEYHCQLGVTVELRYCGSLSIGNVILVTLTRESYKKEYFKQ